MKFSKALKKLRHGKAITRDDWSDGTYLQIENESQNDLYSAVIYQHYTEKSQDGTKWENMCEWQPTQFDLLVNDWHVCPIEVDIKIDNSELGNDYFEDEGMQKIGNIMHDRIIKMMNDGLISGYDGGNQQ